MVNGEEGKKAPVLSFQTFGNFECFIDGQPVKFKYNKTKEMLAYLDGEYSLEETVRLIKRNTRHYAKRQLTWFKRIQETVWLNCADFADADQLSDHIVSLWEKRKKDQE